MADLKSFQLYDSANPGNPLTTATPTFLDYRDRAGTARPPPAIVHVANGVYAFSPSAADIVTGVAWVVASGAGAFPSRYYGDVSAPDTPFQVCLFETGTGALTDLTLTPPTMSFYKTRAGVDIVPRPAIVNVQGGYLWSITPVPADAMAGVLFDISAPAGAYPAHYGGDLLATPSATPTFTVLGGAATATTTTVAEPFAPAGNTSTATGIFQSDLCLQHALKEGMDHLRSTPFLLDSVIRNITFDPLTSKRYGQKELDQLKQWFLKTEIPVVLYRLGSSVAPSISLAMTSTNIHAETLGDIHHEPFEDVADGGSYIIAGPFNPSYDGTTGIMTLPATLSADVFPGMVVMDAKGQTWEITEIVSNVAPISFKIGTKVTASFANATIRGAAPSVIESQESIKFKESWALGVHVNTEPGHLLFLHSIITFILLWGRETLLEARGFELSDFSSTDFSKNQAFEEENVWSRFININGVTQSIWPKRRLQKLAGIKIGLQITDGAHIPSDQGDIHDLAWIGDQDSLSG